MFARKLGRLAGLVFVLTVVFGGVGAAAANAAEPQPQAARSTDSSHTLNIGTEWE
jgi:hypothetical protein|uniref:hypothetical protein n=1 Tax=Paractinoplanes polyasparticus TaxID=2856853 RepID=UPI001C85FE03|nr:hypothetical protein [Actinoplanes polyasparticus]